MRIGVNLLPLRPAAIGGAEVYIRNLLKALLSERAGNDYFLVVDGKNAEAVDFPRGRYVKFCLPYGRSKPFVEEVLPGGQPGAPAVRIRRKSPYVDLLQLVASERFDLWFCPHTSLDPRHIPIPSVITVHDLQHEYYPEFFSEQELCLRAQYYGPSCEFCTSIIAISEHTKKCLLELYDIDPSRIHVVHHGVGEEFLRPEGLIPPGEARKKFALPERFFYYPAHIWPHKNHISLIVALHLLRTEKGADVSLVFSGAKYGESEEIRDALEHYRLEDRVKYVGHVEPQDVPAIFQASLGLVFPSLFEGFGLPLLEAMQSGAPIAAARATSVPEVVGDAAILFDPRKPAEIAQAMWLLLSEPNLRNELIAKGKERVKLFSWEKSAEATLNAFRLTAEKKATVVADAEKTGFAQLGGVHPDGWASPWVGLWFAPTDRFRSILLRGRLESPLKLPQKIAITLNGKPIRCHSLSSYGDFDLRLGSEAEMPFTVGHNLLEFRAWRHFVPADCGPTSDNRRLSFVFRGLNFEKVSGGRLEIRG